jgi:hypothetical protein
MILREMYLLFPLRGDERNIGGHKKEILENCWNKKKT